MEKSALRELLENFFQGTLTPQQGEALLQVTEENEPVMIELFNEMLAEASRFAQPADPGQLKDALQKVLSVDKSPLPVIPVHHVPLLRRAWFRWAAAAAFVAVVTIAVVVSSDREQNKSGTDLAANTVVPAPQNNKARITLADGKVVSLDSLNKGLLAEQGDVRLVKLADGQIAYQTISGKAIEEIHYNTLYNPHGSKVIDMVLSDGSHVWLNAGSSVTYPVIFPGEEREVSVTGEAYFEVTHDTDKPFYVTKGNVEVKVLGTHFNVNAYDDEKDIKVTLLEGSVRISNTTAVAGSSDQRSGAYATLRPGQQAVLDNNTTAAAGSSEQQLRVLNRVDLEAVMAWKNGFFSFNGADIKEVMRQLARWYDLEILYKGTIPKRSFSAEISRNTNLSQLLKILEESSINFIIENKTLIVQP